MRNLPRPGEDRLNLDLDPWAMHAQGMIIELLAGEAAERLAGFEVNPDACNSDKEKACLYARTLCVSDEPVLAYLTYATVEAETILNTLWRAVECCAEELLAKGTIGAEEIFEAIFRGEQLAALNEGRAKRQEWRATIRRAVEFEAQCAPGTISPFLQRLVRHGAHLGAS